MRTPLNSLAPILCVLLRASPGVQGDALRGERLATDDELRWTLPEQDPTRNATRLHPLRSLTSTDFRDLEFLVPLLADKRIVQIGESGHGMAESNLLKARLVRFLHERLGFDVLAFESDLYQCQDADARAAQATAETTMQRCLLGVWHTRELVPLFEHLRASRATQHPLRLAGFDIQPIGTNKTHRPATLARTVARLDSAYAARIRTLDSTLLAEYARGTAARRTYFRTTRAELLGAYDSLAAWLDANQLDLEPAVGRDAVRLARQTARSIAAYARQQTAADNREYAETRDLAMAENVRFLADELFAGRKIIVWAHNYHVSHANQAIAPQEAIFPGVPARAMGSWLREWYGQRLYTIGVYAYAGTAADNAREVYEVVPPAPASLEYKLALGGWRLGYADLTEVLGQAESWPAESWSARYNGQIPQTLVPRNQFDALVFLARVSPSVLMY
jgi:erythromycin esterase